MNTRIYYILTAILFALTTFANAQDREILDALVNRGIVTQQEAEEVLKKSTELLPKEKTTRSIKFIGRVQTQYQNINVDESISGVESSLGTKSSILMRRVFLGVEADVGAGWSATLIADFCRSDGNYLEYVYVSKKVDWDFLRGIGHFGYKKVYFGLEEYSSSSKLWTIERSLATRYFCEGNNGRRLGIGGRHTGFFWDGKFDGIGGLNYSLSITNSFNNNPVSIPENSGDELLYCASISYKKKFENVSIEGGLNFSYTNEINAADENRRAYGDMFGFNPYAKISLYGLDIVSDFLFAKMGNAKNNYTQSASPMGVNVAAEYKFDIGEFGELAPIIRWSWIDTDGRGIKMSDGVRKSNSGLEYDKGQSVYLGLNWYIKGDDLKFQIGYEWAQLNDSKDSKISQHSEANVVRAQVQVLF